MTDEKSKLLTKVSPLIEGQVPDFIQADHPIFVKFLKEYYKFLESGQVTYEVVNSYVRYETTTVAYVLDEKDGDRILTEDTQQFVNGETITGATSGATATDTCRRFKKQKTLHYHHNKSLSLMKHLLVEHLVLKVNLQTIVQTQYKTYNNF